uniref:AlNc14C39G3390 protein n=1 Tax=Albugo laibachii Nc14 TaxID=890382 RepID=F0W9C8_9STRA|nr:AlNc14C39G3390 [Albugo laibachii Nc14]|eukprot:CCA17741.1 AlNc14C39G3390 [Albugo laibachii Nc14]
MNTKLLSATHFPVAHKLQGLSAKFTYMRPEVSIINMQAARLRLSGFADIRRHNISKNRKILKIHALTLNLRSLQGVLDEKSQHCLLLLILPAQYRACDRYIFK